VQEWPLEARAPLSRDVQRAPSTSVHVDRRGNTTVRRAAAPPPPPPRGDAVASPLCRSPSRRATRVARGILPEPREARARDAVRPSTRVSARGEAEDAALGAAPALLTFAAPNFASHDSEDDAATPRGFGARSIDAVRGGADSAVGSASSLSLVDAARGGRAAEGSSSPSLIGALALGEHGAPPQRRRGKIISAQPPASSRTAPWATECVYRVCFASPVAPWRSHVSTRVLTRLHLHHRAALHVFLPSSPLLFAATTRAGTACGSSSCSSGGSSESAHTRARERGVIPRSRS
jgi:hypothetical protein